MSVLEPQKLLRSSPQVEHPVYDELKVLSLRGRLGRSRHVNWQVASGVPLLLLVILIERSFPDESLTGAILSLGVSAIYLAFSLLFTAKRARDVGLSGWLAVLQVVPVINTFFMFAICLTPGNKDANSYGPPPPPNTSAIVVCCIGLVMLMVAIVIYGILGGLPWLFESFLDR